MHTIGNRMRRKAITKAIEAYGIGAMVSGGLVATVPLVAIGRLAARLDSGLPLTTMSDSEGLVVGYCALAAIGLLCLALGLLTWAMIRKGGR